MVCCVRTNAVVVDYGQIDRERVDRLVGIRFGIPRLCRICKSLEMQKEKVCVPAVLKKHTSTIWPKKRIDAVCGNVIKGLINRALKLRTIASEARSERLGKDMVRIVFWILGHWFRESCRPGLWRIVGRVVYPVDGHLSESA